MPRVRAWTAFCALQFLPVGGVAVLGWSPTAVAAFVWLEIAIVVGWTAVETLFVERPSPSTIHVPGAIVRFEGFENTRGGWTISDRLPPVYPHAVPHLLPYLAWGSWWLLLGVLAFRWLGDAATPLAGPYGASIALGAIASLVLRGVVVRDAFLAEHRYEDCSASPLHHRAMEYLVVGSTFVLWLRLGSVGATLLGLLVASKIGYELLRIRPWQLLWYDNILTRMGGYDPPEPARESLDPPRPSDALTVTSARRPTLVAGLRRALRSGAVVLSLAYLLVVGATNVWMHAIVGYWTPIHWALLVAFVGLLAAVALVAVPLATADYAIRHLPVTYEVSTAGVVAVDRWTGEARWHLDRTAITAATVEQRRADRRHGTETLRLRTTEGERVLPHLADATQVRDRLASRPASVGGECL